MHCLHDCSAMSRCTYHYIRFCGGSLKQPRIKNAQKSLIYLPGSNHSISVPSTWDPREAMANEKEGQVSEIVLDLHELTSNSATLVLMSGKKISLPVTTTGKYHRSFTISDLIDTYHNTREGQDRKARIRVVYQNCVLPTYQPLSTLSNQSQANASWTTCLFCWEDLPRNPQGELGPIFRCGFCEETPSWHCGLCCPRNAKGRHPSRLQINKRRRLLIKDWGKKERNFMISWWCWWEKTVTSTQTWSPSETFSIRILCQRQTAAFRSEGYQLRENNCNGW